MYIDHVGINTNDMEATLQFYCGILGMRLVRTTRTPDGRRQLILEPVFEADFQPGSFGYRPKRTAHDAIKRVAEAIVQRKTRVLDFDLRAYFDNVRHDRLLEKVAQRKVSNIYSKARGTCQMLASSHYDADDVRLFAGA